MAAYRPGIDPDRRKGPDIWMRSLRWFAVVGWFLLLVALIFISVSTPQSELFFGKESYRQNISGGFVQWHVIIFFFMILGLGLSILGFFINIKRQRRRDDEYRVSLILLGMISIIGIIIYLNLF